MKKIHQLALRIGQLPSGARDSIADVEGVQVGHAAVQMERASVGLSVVVPYPRSVGQRTLFAGRWALDGGGAASGLGVVEDFGTLSSPMAFAPAPVFGRVYEALIHQGIGRDSGLSTDAGWPPIVIGIDDGAWNDARRVYESVQQRDVDRAIDDASKHVAEGNVGIGHALRAFGLRGGVGTASRLVDGQCVGIFVAVNGGLSGDLRVGGRTVSTAGAVPGGPQEFAAVVATDAALLPFQLRALAQRAGLGAGRCGLWNTGTREAQVWAFSTAVAQDDAQRPALEQVEATSDQVLYGLFAAAAEAMEAAVLSALLEAEPLVKDERILQALSADALRQMGDGQ